MKQETQIPDSKEGLHTQGEWFLSGRNRGNDPLYINVKTTDVDNEPIEIPIAKLLPTLTYISEEQAQANAELIVKAVNEHEKLKSDINKMAESFAKITTLQQAGFKENQKLKDERKALLDENIKLKKELEDYKGYQEYIAEKIYNGDDEILTMGQWEEAGKPDATE